MIIGWTKRPQLLHCRAGLLRKRELGATASPSGWLNTHSHLGFSLYLELLARGGDLCAYFKRFAFKKWIIFILTDRSVKQWFADIWTVEHLPLVVYLCSVMLLRTSGGLYKENWGKTKATSGDNGWTDLRHTHIHTHILQTCYCTKICVQWSRIFYLFIFFLLLHSKKVKTCSHLDKNKKT